MTEERLLTVREVARRCHRSEETIRRWIWSGKLPAKKIGNQLFVEQAEVGELAVDQLRAEARQGRRWTSDEMRRWFESAAQFREYLRQKYGEFDVVAAVREDRDSH